MRRPTPLQWAVTGIALLAGFGMAASALASHGTDLRGGRSATLHDLVTRQADQLQRDTTAAENLRKAVNKLALQIGGIDLTSARADVAVLTPTAGLSAVKGPGLVVTLRDAQKPLADVDPDMLVIHEQDVQAVVNALWRGGAEAVMVMDQRLISTSAVKCVGNTLLLQGKVYSPPYVIRGIGNAKRMQKALDSEVGVQLLKDFARVYGIGYEAAVASEIQIPEYAGTISLPNSQTT